MILPFASSWFLRSTQDHSKSYRPLALTLKVLPFLFSQVLNCVGFTASSSTATLMSASTNLQLRNVTHYLAPYWPAHKSGPMSSNPPENLWSCQWKPGDPKLKTQLRLPECWRHRSKGFFRVSQRLIHVEGFFLYLRSMMLLDCPRWIPWLNCPCFIDLFYAKTQKTMTLPKLSVASDEQINYLSGLTLATSMFSSCIMTCPCMFLNKF